MDNKVQQELNSLLQKFLAMRSRRRNAERAERHQCKLIADLICMHASKVVSPFHILGGYFLVTTHSPNNEGKRVVMLVQQVEGCDRYLINFTTWEKLGLETPVQVINGPSGISLYTLGRPGAEEWVNFSDWVTENVGWIIDFINIQNS